MDLRDLLETDQIGIGDDWIEGLREGKDQEDFYTSTLSRWEDHGTLVPHWTLRSPLPVALASNLLVSFILFAFQNTHLIMPLPCSRAFDDFPFLSDEVQTWLYRGPEPTFPV